MAILVEQALDLKGYAVQQLTLGTAGGAAGGLGFSPTDGLTQNVADGYPYWYDNTLTAHPILPFYDYDTDPTGNGAVRAWDGWVTADTFVGYLSGTAEAATQWLTATSLVISGKATAGSVAVNTGGALNLNVTALSVVPGDVALASGSFIVGNGSNVGAATAKNAIPISGFAAAASSVDFGNQRLIQVGYPVASTDGANKQFVLDQVSGVAPSAPARAATAAALSAYTPSGSPATLTANANGALTVDGVGVSAGDRVLVKNESGANEKYNGLYEVTDAGSAGTPWILDRADDENTDAEVTTGDEYFVVEGTVNGGSNWALATPEPITLGTTALTFVQVGGGQQYSAGNGLAQVGNTFHFATDAGYTQFGVAYASGSTTMAVTGAGSANQVFRVPGGGGAPAFGALDLDSAAATTGTLAVDRGGTNIGSYTVGDLLYASGVSTLSTLSAVATGNVLISGGVDTAPSWGKVDLNNATSSTLTVARGGTGTTTFTSRGLLIGAGTVAIGAIAAPTIGQIVMGDATVGGSLPKFSTVAGDLTATHSGGNATFTIANDAVTFAKMQDISSGVVLGRKTALSGIVEEITFAQLLAELDIDTSVTLTGDVTGSGTGSIATTISNLAFSKLAQGAALSVLGVAASSPATGVVANITSPGANRVLRTASDGSSIGFGAINLSSSNAVSGVLNTGNGGTGVTTNLTFPGVSGAIPLIKTFNLTAGSSQYTIPHGLSTGIMVAMLRNSNGDMVWAEINTDPTNVVVTFGAPTIVGHTLVVVASDTV